MALHLVNANNRFVIYGPVIMNSEVLVYDGNIADMRILGIGDKREYLKVLAQESYPKLEETKVMMSGVLPYSLEDKQIDAAVIDVTKAVLLPKFSFAQISKNDYISYCLIVRKDLIGTEAFNDFLALYNQAVKELNQTETLILAMGMTEEFWNMINIKFLEL